MKKKLGKSDGGGNGTIEADLDHRSVNIENIHTAFDHSIDIMANKENLSNAVLDMKKEEGKDMEHVPENVREQNNVQSVEDVSSTVETMTKMKLKVSLFEKITISFPMDDNPNDITTTNILNPDSLQHIYNHALEHSTHQRQLRESGCNLLSLDEVIIPTIMTENFKHYAK